MRAAVATGITAAVSLIWWLVLLLPRVELRDAVVVIVNPLATYRLRREDIVAVTDGLHGAEFHGRDGFKIHAVALGDAPAGDQARPTGRGPEGNSPPPSSVPACACAPNPPPPRSTDMALISIDRERGLLTAEIQGLDKLWSLKSRLEIPLAHVRGATHDPGITRERKGIRVGGTNLPGVITGLPLPPQR